MGFGDRLAHPEYDQQPRNRARRADRGRLPEQPRTLLESGLTAQGAPGNLANLQASFGDGPKLGVTAPLVDVTKPGNDGLACAALPASSLNGAIALVQRDPTQCDFSTKVRNAEAAGAVGVVIYLMRRERPSHRWAWRARASRRRIVGMTDGQALKSYLPGHAGAQVAIDPTLAAYKRSELRHGGRLLLARAFHRRLRDQAGSGRAGHRHLRRDAALRHQRRNLQLDRLPWRRGPACRAAGGRSAGPGEAEDRVAAPRLKSAVVNTASTGIQDGGAPASLAAVGAGKLNVLAAVQTNVHGGPLDAFPSAQSSGGFAPAVSSNLSVYSSGNRR